MAIKELIKTFALFLGYELPDSSGDTGTILDQMGDSMGDFGAGIDNANSGLDDTKKKAKEVAKAIGNLPFDELHTISKPSNADSGSDSGSGGAGGAMVDPRILDALNKWDYMFGNIRMKAMDIRDTILEWADKIGKVVDENIFKPIKNSWDKYGAGISANVKETFKNIGHIVGGVFDVIGEKWKPFFQQASDLFFSLMETASLVTSTISKFFKFVWDNGGKYLFEAIWDLATAFLKLAKKINDDFVKPIIKLFKDYFAKELGRIIGAVLKTLGDFIKIFSGFIDWIAEDGNPTLKILIATFGLLKLSSLIKEFNDLRSGALGMSDGMSKSDAIITLLTGSFGKLGIGVSNVIIFFRTLMSEGFTKAISLFPTLNKGWEAVTTVVGKFGTSIGNAVSHVGSLVSHLSQGLGNVLGKVGGWLSSASFAPWVLGIAGAITAFTVLINWIQSFHNEIDPVTESINNQTESLKKLNEQTSDGLIKNHEYISNVQTYVKELENSIDAEGNVIGSRERVMYLVGEINKLLPDSVYWTEQGTIAYKDNAEQLKNNIKLKEAEMQLETLEVAYKEASAEKMTALINLEKKNSEMREQQLKIDAAVIEVEQANDKTSRDLAMNRLKQEQHAMKEIEDTRNGALENYKKYTNIVNQYANLSAAIQSGSAKEIDIALSQITTSYDENGNLVVKSLQDEVQELQTLYDQMLIDAKDTNSGITEDALNEIKNRLDAKKEALATEDKLYVETKDKIIANIKTKNAQITEEELQTYSVLLEALNTHGINIRTSNEEQYSQLLKMAKANCTDITNTEGQKYVVLLAMLQENGVTLNEEQAGQYQRMLDIANEYNIDLYDEQGKQYTNLLSLMQRHGVDMSKEENIRHAASIIQMANNGSEEGKELLAKLKQGVESGNIDPELQQILTDAGIVLENNPQSVKVGVEDPTSTVQTMLNNLQSIFDSRKFKVGIDLFAKLTKGVNIEQRATGGFPDVGQLFIANEAGPELIGNLGGRTAVANHYQIEEGIAKAVARGSMGNNSSAPQVINTHITVDLDSEVVAEAVHKSESKKGFNFTKGGGKL